MASSQVEMEEWVKFLRRVAGTPSGGKDSHAQPLLSRPLGRRREQAPDTISLCAVFRGEDQRPLKPLP